MERTRGVVSRTSWDALCPSIARSSSIFAGRVFSSRNGSSVSIAAKRVRAVSTAVSDIVGVNGGDQGYGSGGQRVKPSGVS